MGLGIRVLDVIISFIMRIFLSFTIMWVLILREDPILDSPSMIFLLIILFVWIIIPIIKIRMEEKERV